MDPDERHRSDLELVEAASQPDFCVPTYPMFIRERQRFPKFRRVHTNLKGLFLFLGNTCQYWPSFEEIPSKCPELVRDQLREEIMRDYNDSEAEMQRVIDLYEKYHKLLHIYGQFYVSAGDAEDLESKYEEKLAEMLYDAIMLYFLYDASEDPIWEMSNAARVPCQVGRLWMVVLSGAKLALKPFVEVKFDKQENRTVLQGTWEDYPDSDDESRE